MTLRGVLVMIAGCLAFAPPAGAASLKVTGDGILQPLTATPGDASRGRAIVADRRVGLCLLCHSAPVPEERFQGNLAPSLAGAGQRWTAAQLRLRVADTRRLNPDSLMPAFYRPAAGPGKPEGSPTPGTVASAVTDPQRVAAAYRGKPILDAQQVEDVVAYLATLQ